MVNVLHADRVTAYCALRMPLLLGADACHSFTEAQVRLTDARAPLPLKA